MGRFLPATSVSQLEQFFSRSLRLLGHKVLYLLLPCHGCVCGTQFAIAFAFFFFFMGRRGCEERRRLRFLFPPSEWDCGSISMHSLKLSLLTLPCVRPMEEDVQSVEKCWPRSCTYQRKPDRYNLDRLSSAPLQASHHAGLELHR